jgi:hypothetical protein
MINSRTKTALLFLTALIFTLTSFQFAFADPQTVAEKMALVDGNYPLRVKIARYQYLLTTLEKKTGDSQVRIGDMTAKSRDILREKYGKEITLLELLEAVNKSIPSSRTKVPYANVIAAYVMFAGE